MANIYDVYFTVCNSIAVEANSKEEAIDEFERLTSQEIIERAAEAIREGGLEIGTVELIEEEDEQYEEEDEY